MYVQLYTIQHEIIALFDLLYITFQLDADSCSTVLQNQSICTSFNRIVLEVYLAPSMQCGPKPS